MESLAMGTEGQQPIKPADYSHSVILNGFMSTLPFYYSFIVAIKLAKCLLEYPTLKLSHPKAVDNVDAPYKRKNIIRASVLTDFKSSVFFRRL